MDAWTGQAFEEDGQVAGVHILIAVKSGVLTHRRGLRIAAGQTGLEDAEVRLIDIAVSVKVLRHLDKRTATFIDGDASGRRWAVIARVS